MSKARRDIKTDLRGALIEAKESIEGKRKLNTLDNLISDLYNIQGEDKLKVVEVKQENRI